MRRRPLPAGPFPIATPLAARLGHRERLRGAATAWCRKTRPTFSGTLAAVRRPVPQSPFGLVMSGGYQASGAHHQIALHGVRDLLARARGARAGAKADAADGPWGSRSRRRPARARARADRRDAGRAEFKQTA